MFGSVILWHGMDYSQPSASFCVLWAFKVPKKQWRATLTLCSRLRFYSYSLSYTLTQRVAARLWSRDQPVSCTQCQLFCICRAHAWRGSGLAGAHTKSDHPSYSMPANCATVQVFRDIATVTVQLMDWCYSCSRGITGPVKSEMRQRSVHRWWVTAECSRNRAYAKTGKQWDAC